MIGPCRDAGKLWGQDDTENGSPASRPAYRRGPVKVPVRTERQRRHRVRSVGSLKQEQCVEHTVGRDGENRTRTDAGWTVVERTAETGGSIQPAVIAKGEPKGGLFAVCALETSERGQV